jgi:PIN domain nuclease of toxin-antitoxin system
VEAVIYLDTHTVVWLFAGQLDLFPKRAVDAIEGNDCLISPMVILELHYLFETERIKVAAERIIHELSLSIGLSLCNRPFGEVVTQAVSLKWTRDPFDRIITAQAMAGHASLVTKDDTIRDYYKRAIWD